MDQEEEWITGLCHQTDQLLWHSYERTVGKASPETDCRIHFPLYRSKLDSRGKLDRRFSEQEARFAFAHVLASAAVPEAHRDIVFSVENPTNKAYSFSGAGKGWRSAATDLAIYRNAQDDVPFANIEFKAGGLSEKLKDKGHIEKDVAKLLAEPICFGVWFHLVRRAGSETLPGIIATLEQTFKKMWEIESGQDKSVLGKYTNSPIVEPKILIIHLCVIEQQYSWQRKVEICTDGWNDSISLPTKSNGKALPETDSFPGWTPNGMKVRKKS
jgi:hypothetical protein